jgi:circadian clock protein KaiC
MAQQGLLDVEAPAEITYLADNVVLLRYFEFAGSIKKALSVVKKRVGGHETTIRELVTVHGRIEVGEPLQEFQGILKGVPTYVGNASAILGLEHGPR